MHDTKIGIVVDGDLRLWQKLNVTAFLASGVAAANSECVGQEYEDRSGQKYLAQFVQPVFVYEARRDQLQRTRARALSRGVAMALYTAQMFETGHDSANRAVVRAVATDDLEIVGLALRADRKTFDKIVNGLKLHG